MCDLTRFVIDTTVPVGYDDEPLPAPLQREIEALGQYWGDGDHEDHCTISGADVTVYTQKSADVTKEQLRGLFLQHGITVRDISQH